MSFVFDSKPTVDICGKLYECDPTDNDLIAGVSSDFPNIIQLAGELSELQKQCATAFADPINSSNIQRCVVEKNTELTKACRAFIFGCIGEQEYAEVFTNRRPNSTEHVKLCIYLFDFIMGGREAVVAEYADPPEGCYAVDSTAKQNS